MNGVRWSQAAHVLRGVHFLVFIDMNSEAWKLVISTTINISGAFCRRNGGTSTQAQTTGTADYSGTSAWPRLIHSPPPPATTTFCQNIPQLMAIVATQSSPPGRTESNRAFPVLIITTVKQQPPTHIQSSVHLQHYYCTYDIPPGVLTSRFICLNCLDLNFRRHFRELIHCKLSGPKRESSSALFNPHFDKWIL